MMLVQLTSFLFVGNQQVKLCSDPPETMYMYAGLTDSCIEQVFELSLVRVQTTMYDALV